MDPEYDLASMYLPRQLRPLRQGEFVRNPDGSVSTERSVTVDMPDGSIANGPSLWMSPKGPVDVAPLGDDLMAALLDGYERRTGQPFPRFGSYPVAEMAAQARSAHGGVYPTLEDLFRVTSGGPR